LSLVASATSVGSNRATNAYNKTLLPIVPYAPAQLDLVTTRHRLYYDDVVVVFFKVTNHHQSVPARFTVASKTDER
jgi:hypothetical protein